MRRVDQYRFGQVAPAVYIPLWIHNEVMDARVTNELRAMETFTELTASRAPYESRLAWAKSLLGIDGPAPAGLVRIVQKLVDQNPEAEADYWDAMWTVKKVEETQAEYELVTVTAADFMERRAQYAEAGWPANWPLSICDTWQKAGGTPATATAWASAGWPGWLVLTEELKQNGRSIPLSSRVRETHPIEFSRYCGDDEDEVEQLMVPTLTRQAAR